MSITRRDLFTGLSALGLASVAPSRLAWSQPAPQRVRLAKASEFGAVGDGRTDATAALRQALASGHVIDGAGGRFMIRGDLVARSGFKGLVDATLVEGDPKGGKQRVLEIEDAEDFVLEHLKVERGGTGAEDADRRDLGRTGGIFLTRCRGFAMRGIEVSGGGIGSGLAVIDGTDFTIDDAHSHDIWYQLAEIPSDDAIQGLFFVRCKNFKLRSCKANDLGGSVGASVSRDENRGFAFAACRNFKIIDAQVRRLGQGIDITGSDGNFDFWIENGTAEDCATYGFKCANTAQRGRIAGAVARRCGIAGFIVSGPAERSIPPSQDIMFDRCVAENVLGNYKNADGSGFAVRSTKIDPSFPRGVVLRNCIARSTAGGMDYGFRNDVPSALTDGRPNRLISCQSTGFVRSFELGFGA